MTINSYDVGDLIRCTGTFTNAAGTAVDPTTVTFKVEDASGDVTSYVYDTDPEVVRDGTGVYHVDVSIDEAGRWQFRWESTGTGQAAGESEFWIRPAGVGSG